MLEFPQRKLRSDKRAGQRAGTDPVDKHVEILREMGGEGNDRLERALARLEIISPPIPSPDETARLVAKLAALAEVAKQPGLPVGASPAATRVLPNLRALRHAKQVVSLVAPQIEAFGRTFWVWSAVVMITGVAVLSTVDHGINIWVHASPLFAVACVAWSLRSRYYGVSELEMSCPYSQAHLLAARMLLVLLYNLAFGLIAVGVLGVSLNDYGRGTLMLLVMNWIGPLCFLAGVALYVSVRFGIVVGSLTSLALWGLGTYLSIVPPYSAGLDAQPDRAILARELADLVTGNALVLDGALVAFGFALITASILRARHLEPISGAPR